MGTIYIRDLRAEAVIGIYGWEREVRQTVSMDVEMDTDTSAAAREDDIEHSINYKQVAKQLLQLIEGSRFRLVETLAERAAQLVMREFAVGWVRIRVSKPGALRHASDVGVIIERGQRKG